MTQPLTLSSLPLFPLNTVLFPGGQLPLRVSELRYLDMVRKCHKAGSPFGVVALTEGSEVRSAGLPPTSFHSVGTLAQITQLNDRQPDLLHVQCSGHSRMHVDRKQLMHQGLWVAEVSIIPVDQHMPVPDDLLPASQALALVLHNLRLRQQAQEDRLYFPTVKLPQPLQLNDCGWVANRWCELLPIPLTLKQQLLELDSPLLRLELVCDVLERTGIVL